jgi:hypothetical protein
VNATESEEVTFGNKLKGKHMFVVVFWKTEDGGQHYHNFKHNSTTPIEEFIKELYNKADMSSSKDDKISELHIIDGAFLDWEKEEVTTVKRITIKGVKQ